MVMQSTLFPQGSIIPGLVNRVTSHITMGIDAPDVSIPDRQCSYHQYGPLLRRDELFRLVC